MTHDQAISTFASERYLLDEMNEAERSNFEEHFFDCADCADDVRAGALMREGARAGFLASAGRPDNRLEFPAAPAARRGWQRSAMIPWALAASLAVVAGYESLVVVPGLRSQTGTQALSPVTLRPASRGESPVVTIDSATSSVALAIDLASVTASGSANYDLRTAAGASVAAGRAELPAAGAPLLIVVPSRVLAPGGYVLSVADSEYHFEVRIP